MIVVLEGPDGGGKTTLARRLEQLYGFRYVHTGPPGTNEDLLEAYGRTLFDARRQSGSVVIDRLHVGERVYGPLLRGKDRLGRPGEVLIHRMLAACGGQLVFCLPPFEVALDNWRKRHADDQELVKKENTYREIYHAYRNLTQDFFYAEASWWNYTMTPMELAADALLKLNIERQVAPEGVIGNPQPKFLFVGEKANQEYLDVPFFSLSGSSEYLNGAIAEAGYQERDIAFVNARRLDGSKVPLGATHKSLGEPIVIALGVIAANALISQGVTKFHALDHPAYWKRFHASQRGEYVACLKRIRLKAYEVRRPAVS